MVWGADHSSCQTSADIDPNRTHRVFETQRQSEAITGTEYITIELTEKCKGKAKSIHPRSTYRWEIELITTNCCFNIQDLEVLVDFWELHYTWARLVNLSGYIENGNQLSLTVNNKFWLWKSILWISPGACTVLTSLYNEELFTVHIFLGRWEG